MTKARNKKKYFEKNKKKNDSTIVEKELDKKNNISVFDDVLIEKFRTYKQSQLLIKINKNNNEPTHVYLLLFLFFSSLFNIYFKYMHQEYIVYYVYAILFSFSILYLFKINWKTTAILFSIFTLVKYLFLNYQLSNYYSSSIYFDIYMVFISLLIFYFVFLIELFLLLLYVLTLLFSMFIRSIKKFYRNNISKHISNYVIFLIFLLTPIYPLFSWNIYFGKFYLLSITVTIIIFSIFMLFTFLNKENFKNYNWDLNLENHYLASAVFKIFEDVNLKISRLHENMTFISDFSFLKLGRVSRIFFLCLTLAWIGNTLSIIKFFDTYNYNIIFYEQNNGYCSNLNKDDLTFKTTSYESILLLSYKKRDDSYLLKEGYFNSNIGVFKNKNSPKYYIYEIKCEHKYKKI